MADRTERINTFDGYGPARRVAVDRILGAADRAAASTTAVRTIRSLCERAQRTDDTVTPAQILDIIRSHNL